jgi:hypothetical protein
MPPSQLQFLGSNLACPLVLDFGLGLWTINISAITRSSDQVGAKIHLQRAQKGRKMISPNITMYIANKIVTCIVDL